jgi:hypothetical protein
MWVARLRVRGDRLRRDTDSAGIGFQSAPRPRGRGDCGLVFRLGRKAFLPLFRQPANPSRTKGFSVVKEQLQISMRDTVMQRREIPVAGPSLGVRGAVLILPTSIDSQLSTLNSQP